MRIKIRFRTSSLLTLIAIASVVFAVWVHQQRRQAQIAAVVPLIATIDRGNNENPTTIITVLNELKRIGHSGTLEAMRLFDSKHTSKSQNVEILAQLLFDRKNPDEKFPSMVRSELTDYELDRDNWRYDIEIVDNIPFATNVLPISYSGIVYPRSYAIKWADERGRLNSVPLLPTNNPFKTTEELIQRLVVERTYQYSDQDSEFIAEIPDRVSDKIQEQVYQMVKHLVPEIETPEWGEWSKRPDLWRKLENKCLESGLQWSPTRNCYIFTK